MSIHKKLAKVFPNKLIKKYQKPVNPKYYGVVSIQNLENSRYSVETREPIIEPGYIFVPWISVCTATYINGVKFQTPRQKALAMWLRLKTRKAITKYL